MAEDFVNIEHKAAQYSEDGKILIKYEGNAESYAIREGTTDILKDAFSDNETLKTIYLPASVRNIWNPFNGCKNLVAIEVDSKNPNFFSEDGILYRGTRCHRESLFRFPMAKVMDVLHVKTSHIEEEAFYKCSGIREVFIEPENGESLFISHNAFSKSSIRVLHLCAAKGKPFFYYDIFDECNVEVYAPIPKLITKTICLGGKWHKVWPDHFPELKEEEFEVTQDEEGGIYSADGIRLVKYMGQGNIYKIKEGTRIISAHAFTGRQNLVSISIPKSVEYISKEAVDGCPNLCHVFVAPDNVGEYAAKDGKLVHDEEETIFTFSKIAD